MKRVPARLLPAGEIRRRVPNTVKLEGDCLVWLDADDQIRWPDKLKDGSVSDIGLMGPQALYRFERLASAPGSSFVAFARQWGILALDPEGWPVEPDDLPGEADPAHGVAAGLRTGSGPVPAVPMGMWRREPVEAWRGWADLLAALRNLGFALRMADADRPEDRLSRVIEDYGLPVGTGVGAKLHRELLAGLTLPRKRANRPAPGPPSLVVQRQRYAGTLSHLLQLANDREPLVPSIGWPAGIGPELRLAERMDVAHLPRPTSILPALLREAADLALRGERLTLCSVCGVAFAPLRRVNNPRCDNPECQKKAGAADTRRFRTKVKTRRAEAQRTEN